MPCQAKTEVLEFLHLQTVQQVIDSHQMLYNIGYRGSLNTSSGSARIDMQMPDAVSVTAAVNDVILYRVSPTPQVVSCRTFDDFTATFDIVP